MTDAWLTRQLAQRVHRWRSAPGRFVKANRSWTPDWKFKPLTNIEQAFELLGHAGADYVLTKTKRAFLAEVTVGGKVGRASDMVEARAISIALARAIGKVGRAADMVEARAISIALARAIGIQLPAAVSREVANGS
jgi:hypothetical protein